MLHALSGPLGMAFIVAALLVTAALEVLDQRATPGARSMHGEPRPGGRALVRGLHVALAVLAVAALAATAVRVFVVVR